MALNLPNFLQTPIQQPNYAFGDLFKNVLQGYEMARVPTKIMQDEERAKLSQSLLQSQLNKSQMEEPFIKAIKQAELDKLKSQQRKIENEAQQQTNLMKVLHEHLFNNKNNENVISNDESDRVGRAAILAEAGDYKGALKIIAEKPQKPIEEKATRQFVAKNQQAAQAITNVVPAIQSLMQEDIPYQNPWYLGGNIATTAFSPERQARYESKISSIVDQIVVGFDLPKTAEGIHVARSMVEKHPGERDEAYHQRLKELLHELEERKKLSLKASPYTEKLFGTTENVQSNNDPLGIR